MRAKRVIAALLTGALVFNLAACGNTGSGGDSSGMSSQNSGNGGTETAKGEEPLTVTMMVSTKATQGDWNDYWLLKYIEEKCGVKFEVDQITADAWSEKKNLAFTSKDLPMVFLNNLSDTELATYGSQGLILPLEEYITKENMPNLFKVIEEEGYNDLLTGMYFPDGHIYAIRGIDGSQREYARPRFFINEAWSKKLGFEKLPTNLDEFYEYLCAVRDGDPNENGDSTDEIPLAGSYREGTSVYYDNFIVILTAFGYLSETYQVDENGQVIYVPVQDNYREFLKYMNKLYTEKLLDPRYFVQTADERKAKEASNLCGAFQDYASYLNVPDLAVSLQFRGMEPMTSDYNDVKMWPAKDVVYSGAMVLTNQVQDEETIKKLLAVADWFYSEEGTYAALFGPTLGQNEDAPEYGWQLETSDVGTESRKWVYDEAKFESASEYCDFNCTPGNNYFPTAQTAERCLNSTITMEVYEMEDTSNDLRLTYDIMNGVYPYQRVGWPTTVKFTAEEADELSLIETDLNSFKETMESKMISGEQDIDANWDEFVSGLKARSLDRYLEILQIAYDRWRSNQ